MSFFVIGTEQREWKNDRYCGSCLHLATVFCLHWDAAQLNKKSSGNDMKSGVVMVAIGDFICMLLGLDLVLYIEGHLYILYITLSRLICSVFSV